jgi:hypothetical protein
MLSSAADNTLPDDAPAEAPSVKANEISGPAARMAIAAHPGDAVFTMGGGSAGRSGRKDFGQLNGVTHDLSHRVLCETAFQGTGQ